MNREQAIESIKEKFDAEALFHVLRYANKNPSHFECGESKESINYDDIMKLLVDEELRKCSNCQYYKEVESNTCGTCSRVGGDIVAYDWYCKGFKDAKEYVEENL